jgi:hypothetical protein
MTAMPKPVAIDRLELAIAPHRWPFAEAWRDEIDAHFATRCRAVPNLWNGRVLLMNDVAVAGGAVRGTFFETGFADFLAWRDWGFPDRSVVNCFAMAALRASDGRLPARRHEHVHRQPRSHLLSRRYARSERHPRRHRRPPRQRAARTRGGDRSRSAGPVILAAPDWTAVVAGPRIALMKEVRARRPAAELRASILGHLASEARPELADMWIVRSPADFDPAMPEFVTAYLSHVWSLDGAR